MNKYERLKKKVNRIEISVYLEKITPKLPEREPEEKPKIPKLGFWSEFKEYKKKVFEITERQPLHTLKNYDKRGFKGYHLDHNISIFYGFKHGMPPEEIGDISNIQFITREQNMEKNTKCYCFIQ